MATRKTRRCHWQNRAMPLALRLALPKRFSPCLPNQQLLDVFWYVLHIDTSLQSSNQRIQQSSEACYKQRCLLAREISLSLRSAGNMKTRHNFICIDLPNVDIVNFESDWKVQTCTAQFWICRRSDIRSSRRRPTRDTLRLRLHTGEVHPLVEVFKRIVQFDYLGEPKPLPNLYKRFNTWIKHKVIQFHSI